VVELACSNYPESYAGSSVATIVGSSMPDRSKVTTQTKKDTLLLYVGDWAWGYQPHPIKNRFC